jgi:hypothetical protein
MLGILFLVELYVFVKVKLRIDFLGTFTLITQLALIIARLCSIYFNPKSLGLLAFLTFSVSLLVASTYIFVLEIVKIQLAKQPGTSQQKFKMVKRF